MLYTSSSAIRLFFAIFRGLRTDHYFRSLVWLLTTLLFTSTVFYTKVEKWAIIDSLYFSVMTISTIGHVELIPSTSGSKIFTMFFALFGIGIFAAVVYKIVQHTLKVQTKHIKPNDKE